MEGLLKWSIAAQNGDTTSKPDPKALAQLFGAPDEVSQMRAELTVASDSKDKDERVEYLEKFEEHVENVDNANNIGDMWKPLVALTSDPDNDVRAVALSCIAAAVQNNDKSQNDFLNIKDGIESVMSSVSSSNDLVSTKALFALSSSIAHNQSAYDRFENNKGWDLVAGQLVILENSGTSQKRKTRILSLILSIVLLLPNNEVYNHLDKLQIQKKLEVLESKESGIIKERTSDILKVIKENPRAPVKLLQ